MSLAQSIAESAAVGAALSFTPGPAMFAVLDLSIARGRLAALWFAAGLFANDLTIALLCYAGLARFLGDANVRGPIGLAGGLLLVAMGAVALRAKPPSADRGVPQITRSAPAVLVIHGALLNMLNPFLFAFWLSFVGATATRESDFGWAFLVACALGALAGDVIKAVVADALRERLSPSVVRWLRCAQGAGLLAFGARAAWLAI